MLLVSTKTYVGNGISVPDGTSIWLSADLMTTFVPETLGQTCKFQTTLTLKLTLLTFRLLKYLLRRNVVHVAPW